MMKAQRSGILAIIKKEFTRFFTDKRMVFTTILLPGLMIYLLYSVMGNSLNSLLTVDEDYVPEVYAVNLPGSVKAMADGANLSFTPATPDEVEGIKEQIANKEADLLVVFPTDFDASVTSALTQVPGGQDVPEVGIYYNSTRTESSAQYSIITTLLDTYKSALVPLFTINAAGDTYDLVTEKDLAGFSFAAMLPFLLIILLYSSCISVAPESIAGEKERGTMATMLVTPLARWELALGKVVSLGCIALLAGVVSFIAIILSLPSIMGTMDASFYGTGDYVMVLVVILSTVLMFIGIISVISAFARSVKEASTAVMPLMIVVMLVGVLGIFSQSAQTQPLFYAIPVYNSVQSLTGIFSFTSSPLLVAITVAVNLVVTALSILALTKMFNSEKVMFSR